MHALVKEFITHVEQAAGHYYDDTNQVTNHRESVTRFDYPLIAKWSYLFGNARLQLNFMDGDQDHIEMDLRLFHNHGWELHVGINGGNRTVTTTSHDLPKLLDLVNHYLEL